MKTLIDRKNIYGLQLSFYTTKPWCRKRILYAENSKFLRIWTRRCILLKPYRWIDKMTYLQILQFSDSSTFDNRTLDVSNGRFRQRSCSLICQKKHPLVITRVPKTNFMIKVICKTNRFVKKKIPFIFAHASWLRNIIRTRLCFVFHLTFSLFFSKTSMDIETIFLFSWIILNFYENLHFAQ